MATAVSRPSPSSSATAPRSPDAAMAAVAADPGAPVMAQEPTAPPVGVWRALGERIAFGTYVPVPVSPDLVEERAFESRSGETYHVLKQRARKTYLSLPPEAY